MEPAAPYPDPGSALLKYNAMAVFPIVNNNPVTIEPINTCRQVILASGKILKMSAKRADITANEIIKFRI